MFGEIKNKLIDALPPIHRVGSDMDVFHLANESDGKFKIAIKYYGVVIRQYKRGLTTPKGDLY